MSFKKLLLGALSLLFTTAMQQLPAQAETPSAEALRLTGDGGHYVSNDFSPSAAEAPVNVAQSRRRGASTTASSAPDFIGAGVGFGYVNDVSGVVISKVSIAEKWAVRPSLSFGDDFAVLVPITYQFDNSVNVGGARLSPYVGAGGSWSNENNNNGNPESDLKILVSAGVDVPLSNRFTLNAQANLGFINDTEFGGTIGVGYNIGNILR